MKYILGLLSLFLPLLILMYAMTQVAISHHTLPEDHGGKGTLYSQAIPEVQPRESRDEVKQAVSAYQEEVIPVPDGWQLIWHEEFNESFLNQSKWSAEDWAAEKNNELQYYRPDNLMLENGLLKIVSLKENFGGRHYTSGAIHTKDKFSFLYGKVEMRAKLPRGQGIFPAFWMMPNKDQVWLPEIDILEMLGHKPEEIWMVLHWLNEEGRLTSVSDSFVGPDYSAGFHTFGIEWSEEKVAWFIDGVKRFETDTYVPKEEMYLYVNTAIGGNWPGSPDETTSFPQYFLVDYIRVFQKK